MKNTLWIHLDSLHSAECCPLKNLESFETKAYTLDRYSIGYLRCDAWLDSFNCLWQHPTRYYHSKRSLAIPIHLYLQYLLYSPEKVMSCTMIASAGCLVYIRLILPSRQVLLLLQVIKHSNGLFGLSHWFWWAEKYFQESFIRSGSFSKMIYQDFKKNQM